MTHDATSINSEEGTMPPRQAVRVALRIVRALKRHPEGLTDEQAIPTAHGETIVGASREAMVNEFFTALRAGKSPELRQVVADLNKADSAALRFGLDQSQRWGAELIQDNPQHVYPFEVLVGCLDQNTGRTAAGPVLAR